MAYPKWLYHKKKEAVIVSSEEEEKELGAGWKESPAEFEKTEEKDEKEKAGGK